MQRVKDASALYEVERRTYHAARPGFRIAELQISPAQKVPWRSRPPHLITSAGDASAVFLVLQGIGEYDFVPLT